MISIPRPAPDRCHYRKLRLSAARFRVDLETKHWCDLWHQHFDWNGFGNLGWAHRRRHVAALLQALSNARRELSHVDQPYQLFAIVYPRSSTDDAIYVHTPNPHRTEYPCAFPGSQAISVLPPLLAGRIDQSAYSVLSQTQDSEPCFIIIPKKREAP